MSNSSIFKSLFILLFVSTFSFVAKAGEPLKKGATIKFALILPETDFGKLPSGIAFSEYEQKETNLGYGLQIGSMYFVKKFTDAENMAIGIDVTWLGMSYNAVTFGNNRNHGDTLLPSPVNPEFEAYYITFFAEVGPSFSYSPTDQIAIDVSFKFTPTMGLTGSTYKLTNGDKEGIGGAGFSLRYTPALYFRYNVLLIGAEYSFGDMNFKYDREGGLDLDESEATVPYSTLRIVLGMKF